MKSPALRLANGARASGVAMNKPNAARHLMADHLVATDIDMSPANSLANDHNARSVQNFRLELLKMIPQLRAFVRMLISDKASAEELSQETLAEAWRSRLAFWPETNIKVWLFTIARNKFYSNRHYDRRGASLGPGTSKVPSPGVVIPQAMSALRSLPDLFREALILVSASGCSYQEAARICNCPVGTIKSRIFRARREMMDMFELTPI
jgi:RNA polymerase sigma-70 factor, ECF subfamily